VPAERFLKMSLTADIVSTVSGFFAERNYPESEAVLLVKELIEDLDGNPETYGVEESVARSYAWHKEHASQQSFAPDVAMCEDCGKSPVMEGCSVCAECGL